MSIIVWTLLGVIAGLAINKVNARPGENLILDVLLGAASALAGGMIIEAMGGSGRGTFDISTALGALITSVTVLLVFRFGSAK